MAMDYVRVRKDTIKNVKCLIEKRNRDDWHVIAAVCGIVLAVAIAGIVVAL
jgi:hypothetical protein